MDYIKALEQNRITLRRIPPDDRTHDICLAAVKQNGFALGHVPPDRITHDICLAAVKQNGMSLQDVPPDRITPEICLEAVKQNGRALTVVPDITPEICLAAVQQNGNVLQSVPPVRKTLQVCIAAINYVLRQPYESDDIRNWNVNRLFRFVPEALRDQVAQAFKGTSAFTVLTQRPEFLSMHHFPPELSRHVASYVTGPNGGKRTRIKANTKRIKANTKRKRTLPKKHGRRFGRLVWTRPDPEVCLTAVEQVYWRIVSKLALLIVPPKNITI